MSHRRRTPSLIAALVLCLGMLGTAPSARADANEELGEGQIADLAADIERVADLIMVEGDTSETSSRSRGGSDALADYFDTLRTEQRSMEEYGGVTVLDTTADIEVLSSAASGSQILGELHVTRTVAELPEGELWEEVLPVTLEIGSDGALNVLSVGVQDSVVSESDSRTSPTSGSATSSNIRRRERARSSTRWSLPTGSIRYPISPTLRPTP